MLKLEKKPGGTFVVCMSSGEYPKYLELKGRRFTAEFAAKAYSEERRIDGNDDDWNDESGGNSVYGSFPHWEMESRITDLKSGRVIHCFIHTEGIESTEWWHEPLTDLLHPLKPNSKLITDPEILYDFILEAIVGRVGTQPDFPTPRIVFGILEEPRETHNRDHLVIDFQTMRAHGILLTEDGQRALPLVP